MMIEWDNDDELYDGLKNVRDMYGETRKSFLELNNEEIEKFRLMNAKLMEYENVMRIETEKLFTDAEARVDDKSDVVKDFELIVELYFYLDEKDPAYSDDFFESDNIMTILRTDKTTPLNWDWGYGDDNCHNTIPSRQGTIIENDKHCATFHALYDHTELSYKEIVRIGAFEMDVKVHFGYENNTIFYH